MHKLLERQIKRYAAEHGVPPVVAPLMEAIEQTYLQADEDRIRMERSLELTSRELLAQNHKLREQVEEKALAGAELEARRAEGRLILELCPNALAIRAGDRIVYANAAFLEMFGYPSIDAVVGKSVLDFHHPDQRTAVADRIAEFEAGATLHERNWERTMLRRDGTAVFAEISLPQRIRFEGRDAAIVVFRDVTARRAAEHALRESEESLRQLFDQSPVPKFAFDEETLTLVAANAAASQLYGHSLEELLRMRLPDLRADADIPPGLRDASARPRGADWEGVSRHRRKDGSILDVEIAARAAVMHGRQCRIAVVRDVTEKRKLEEQLRQSQKMEAVGQLAGGVAHDFNNLLTVILSYSGLILNEMKADDPMRRDLEEISLAGTRAASLTRQLLAFSRKQVPQLKTLNLGLIVTGIENMLERLIGEDITMIARTNSKLHSVSADPGQIEQLVMNLVVNARDAMPRGGTLTVETANVHLDESFTRVNLGTSPGPHVRLRVADTGMGMDEATRARIFEPFFTTKGVGKGTGLGLSTVFGIVEQCKAHISVESELGRGSTFTIHFPSVAHESTDALPLPAIAAHGHETILIVEDEMAVRNVARAILSRQGYRVLEAQSASEALLVFQSGAKIDLLLTDVVMPDMSGGELVERVNLLRPGLLVLYMSGYNEDAIVQRGIRTEVAQFLQKPLTPETLTRKVRGVFDASHGK